VIVPAGMTVRAATRPVRRLLIKLDRGGVNDLVCGRVVDLEASVLVLVADENAEPPFWTFCFVVLPTLALRLKLDSLEARKRAENDHSAEKALQLGNG
jgi:hypothetical protein